MVAADRTMFVGNLPELFQSQVGDADFKYQKEYGDVVKIKGAFGVSLLPPDTSKVLFD